MATRLLTRQTASIRAYADAEELALKAAQAQMLRVERMASLGKLALTIWWSNAAPPGHRTSIVPFSNVE